MLENVIDWSVYEIHNIIIFVIDVSGYIVNNNSIYSIVVIEKYRSDGEISYCWITDEYELLIVLGL